MDDHDDGSTAEDPNRVYSEWNNLADLILEEIFTYLKPRERYYAGLVSARRFHL